MATDNVVTIAGNLTADPELRFTPSGAAVINFTVAQTPRYFDNNTSEWKDGDTVFLRVNVWRDHAENIAESLQRGSRVICVGSLRQRNWEDKDGNPRTSYEMTADEVAASMKFATVKVNRRTHRADEPPPLDDPWGREDNPPAADEDEAPADEAPPAAQPRSNARSGNGRGTARTTERRERAARR